MNRIHKTLIGVVLGLLMLVTLAHARRPSRNRSHAQVGLASYYSSGVGPRTANGERFDPNALTAAHRTLPFGTHVRVTNLRNGRSVIVRINDRGPFASRRVIDLSHAAARRLRLIGTGVGQVRLDVLTRSQFMAVGRADALHDAIQRRPPRAVLETLWRRRVTEPWGPVAAKVDATRRPVAPSREEVPRLGAA
jgi:rare lipoprotein A (peptidoglycan hydrolase)